MKVVNPNNDTDVMLDHQINRLTLSLKGIDGPDTFKNAERGHGGWDDYSEMKI